MCEVICDVEYFDEKWYFLASLISFLRAISITAWRIYPAGSPDGIYLGVLSELGCGGCHA